MHQGELFSSMAAAMPRPNVSTPIARKSDPGTSHTAGERLRESGKLREQQRQVLDALIRWPGSTAVEIATNSGLDRYLVSRRLPELVPQYARRGKPRTCSVNGSAQTTWYPVR